MIQQAASMQRKEKFKEKEVRPKVEDTLLKKKVLRYLEGFSDITEIAETEKSDKEILGEDPIARAMKIRKEEILKKNPDMTEEEVQKQLKKEGKDAGVDPKYFEDDKAEEKADD